MSIRLLILSTSIKPGLRKKTVQPGVSVFEEHLRNPGSTDLFGSADAIVKHVLEVYMYLCIHISVFPKSFLYACCLVGEDNCNVTCILLVF